MEKTRKHRTTARDFFERPETITRSLVKGTMKWCDLHGVGYPPWVIDARRGRCRKNIMEGSDEPLGRNAYTALLALCDIRLAVAYNIDEFWRKGLEEASMLEDIVLMLETADRSPAALDEAERVCRELNEGYRAVMEAREGIAV